MVAEKVFYADKANCQDPIAYLEINPAGEKTAFLIHGLGATSHSWQLQFSAFEEAGLRVIAPDIPGFGQSPFSQTRWSLKAVARSLENLVEQVSGTPVHLIGISMGGALAIQMILDRPEIVDRLVLVNTFARLWPDSIKGWLYFLQRIILVSTQGPDIQAKYVAERIFPQPDQEILRTVLIEQIQQADPSVYRSAMRALGLFNVVRQLKTIHSPVLVVTGEKDTTVPRRVQNQLAVSIAHANQVLIPGAGHAVIADQPTAFNQAVLPFLI